MIPFISIRCFSILSTFFVNCFKEFLEEKTITGRRQTNPSSMSRLARSIVSLWEIVVSFNLKCYRYMLPSMLLIFQNKSEKKFNFWNSFQNICLRPIGAVEGPFHFHSLIYLSAWHDIRYKIEFIMKILQMPDSNDLTKINGGNPWPGEESTVIKAFVCPCVSPSVSPVFCR